MFGFISDKLNKGTFLNLYIQHEETFIFPFYCFFLSVFLPLHSSIPTPLLITAFPTLRLSRQMMVIITYMQRKISGISLFTDRKIW